VLSNGSRKDSKIRENTPKAEKDPKKAINTRVAGVFIAYSAIKFIVNVNISELVSLVLDLGGLALKLL
jgi:hypothetical protein